MNNVHPLISKLLNDWRYSASHPRQTEKRSLVDKVNQGVPLASKDKDIPHATNDFKTDRNFKPRS